MSQPQSEHGVVTTAADVAAARAELEEKRAAYEERVRAAMAENGFEGEELPSLEALREERMKLSETVRHHKDEQDALELNIENQEGASEVYHTAARVERFERFAAAAQAYVEGPMQDDVDAAVEEDLKASEDEVAAFIQELQQKREEVLAKINKNQKRAAGAAAGSDEPQLDEQTQESVRHVEENNNQVMTLSDKIKKYRAMRTKLSAELSQEKADAVKSEKSLGVRIKNAELANARDARQCKELNNANATLTNNAAMLLQQLNVEHYGYDGAPSSKQVIEARKAREATPEPSPERDRAAPAAREESESSQPRQRSRRSSISKPPLVAMKQTEAQRSRDRQVRDEREEQERQQQSAAAARRGSVDGSYNGSRRASITRPPLVASKPTEAQRIRDEQVRSEREEQERRQQQPARRPRSQSVTSDAPSAANKSTASQRSREGKA